MDRSEMTLAMAGALAGAFLLGWIMRWFFGRMNARGPRNAARTRDMASQLHAAEDARHLAEMRLAEVEREAAGRLAELQAEFTAVRAAYRQALSEREPR